MVQEKASLEKNTSSTNHTRLALQSQRTSQSFPIGDHWEVLEGTSSTNKNTPKIGPPVWKTMSSYHFPQKHSYRKNTPIEVDFTTCLVFGKKILRVLGAMAIQSEAKQKAAEHNSSCFAQTRRNAVSYIARERSPKPNNPWDWHGLRFEDVLIMN